MCRYPSLRKNILIAGTLYSINNYVYYGSVYGLEALKGSIYFNSIFSAVADLIGNLCVGCTIQKFKRRHVFISMALLMMVSSFSFFFIIIPDDCLNDESQLCW